MAYRQGLAHMKNKFRLRRWLFGKHRRNKIVQFLARQSFKNIAHFNNEDRNHLRNGEYWLQKTLIRYFLNKGITPTIFDVGANNGEWSVNMLNLSPAINLHCFEPSKKTFDILSQKLAAYPNVTLNMVGLSGKKHSIEFYENDGSDVTSLYHRFKAKNKTKISVNLITGDSYLSKKRIEKIDFLKIDIEGMEYDALLGLKESFAHKKVRVISLNMANLIFILKNCSNIFTNYYLTILSESSILSILKFRTGTMIWKISSRQTLSLSINPTQNCLP